MGVPDIKEKCGFIALKCGVVITGLYELEQE
jgi:hypothetical protein